MASVTNGIAATLHVWVERVSGEIPLQAVPFVGAPMEHHVEAEHVFNTIKMTVFPATRDTGYIEVIDMRSVIYTIVILC